MAAEAIENIIGRYVSHATEKKCALTCREKRLLKLRYYATGALSVWQLTAMGHGVVCDFTTCLCVCLQQHLLALKLPREPHEPLQEDDFLLSFCSSFQLRKFLEHGSRIVCLDGTHGRYVCKTPNQYLCMHSVNHD